MNSTLWTPARVLVSAFELPRADWRIDLAEMDDHVGRGTVTSDSDDRWGEGTNRFEGGTARLPRRIAALRTLALEGYRVGLTIAPITPVPQWRDGYGALLRDVAGAVAGVPDVDLTVECITHRLTEKSKKVLLGWYPHTKLEMSESDRTRKFGKYGAAKYVYPTSTMAELKSWFGRELANVLPGARSLYWT